jgi:hypothetical protein
VSLGPPPLIPPLVVRLPLQVLMSPHPCVTPALSQNNTPAKCDRYGQVTATSKGAL